MLKGKNMSEKRKSKPEIKKTIVQISLVSIEVTTIGLIFTIIFNFITPTTNLSEHFSRFLIGTSIYEICIYCILVQISDAKKDALLALKTTYNYAILYFETNSSYIKETVITIVNEQLDLSIFNHSDIRKQYEDLKQYINAPNTHSACIATKMSLINIEHSYELEELNWNHSILLRFFK